MTTQYLGNEIYKIWLNDKELILTVNEIKELQCSYFEKFSNDLKTDFDDKILELENTIEKLEDEVDDLKDTTNFFKQKLQEINSISFI